MKRSLLATVSVLAMVGGAAAADVPVGKPVYTKASPAPIAPSWTGPYAGLSIGVVHQIPDIRIFEGTTLSYLNKPRDTALSLGGQVGRNWQHGNTVLGVEADLNWSWARESSIVESIAFGGEFATLASRLSWYGTLRGRGGVLIAPPTLLYATAGIAGAGIRNRATQTAGAFDFGTSGTRLGWTAGAGVEHQYAPNRSIKAEVLYMDFSDKTATQGGYTGRFKNSAIVGRVGVNVRW